MKVMVIPIVAGALRTIPKGLVQGLKLLGNRTSRDHQNYNILKIRQNTGKSPRNLLSLKLQ